MERVFGGDKGGRRGFKDFRKGIVFFIVVFRELIFDIPRQNKLPDCDTNFYFHEKGHLEDSEQQRWCLDSRVEGSVVPRMP